MKNKRRRRPIGRIGLIVGGAMIVGIAVVGGAVNAVTMAAHPAAGTATAVAFVAATSSASTPSAPAHTPTPVHTPTVTTREETVPESVPFEHASVEDSSMAQGETVVTTPGRNGERTRTYRVTLIDGVESTRELVSDVVTTEPVTEVTAVGTYVEPAAPAAPDPPAAAGDCDPNYADACVPIASDVDCAGGSGNGPAYFDGVARVVGRDIYKLDGDGDGWACNGSR